MAQESLAEREREGEKALDDEKETEFLEARKTELFFFNYYDVRTKGEKGLDMILYGAVEVGRQNRWKQ